MIVVVVILKQPHHALQLCVAVYLSCHRSSELNVQTCSPFHVQHVCDPINEIVLISVHHFNYNMVFTHLAARCSGVISLSSFASFRAPLSRRN
jgi:hypothetical protein